jgi:periplasmic copper chaperone A
MRRKPNVKKILLSLLLVSSPAFAAPVTVSDAWFRSLPGNIPAGGYFTAHNGGKKDLAITGASSSACGMLMLHESQNKGGMSGMNMVEKVALPAGGDAKFAPDGYHLMCEQPKMKIGGKVPVTLSLSDGSSVNVNFDVKDAKGQ